MAPALPVASRWGPFARVLELEPACCWGQPPTWSRYSPFIRLHQSRQRNLRSLLRLLPHLGLIVSGGNTILFEINVDKRLIVLAETVDDAAGEAWTKVLNSLACPIQVALKSSA